MINKLLWIVLFINTFIVRINGTMSVTQVRAGEQATLYCLSNDHDHRFMFWQLENKNIVGPGNQFDGKKFNYEVLTGKLFIWSVTSMDAGIYQCVSRGIEDNSKYNINTVELIVFTNANDWTSDFEMNLLRGLTAVMIVLILIAVILIFMLRKQRRNKKFSDMPGSRGTCIDKYQVNAPTIKVETNRGIDNPGLESDLPKVFAHHRNEQALP
ncbi:uncharacterized protein [Chelonus insularis]|uniref:uncharacterized protein n=1 Tax=Chelonus insularis TaxID=460826 RepID=UPI00158EFCD0|nr:uncharacterized protein LOC118065760 [Chelonus insularis]